MADPTTNAADNSGWEDAPSTSLPALAYSNDARLQQINPQWPTGGALAQMQVESGLNPNAVSPAGAQGYAQVMPKTLSAIEQRVGRQLNPSDPADAAEIQYEVLKENLQKFKNPWDALRAYNGGWNQSNWNNPETQEYVPKIQKAISNLNGGDSGWEDAPAKGTSAANGNDGWEDAPTQSSAIGAFARGAEQAAIPTAGGLAAFVPGFEAGGALGAALGPVGAAVGGLAGGLAASMGAGYLLNKGQSYLLNKYPELANMIGLSQQQLQADAAKHPYASFAGELAPQLLAMRPSAEGFTSLPGLVGTGAGAVLGGGQEAVREYNEGQGFDPTKLAMATGAGALMNKPWLFGHMLGLPGGAPVEPSAAKLEPTPEAAPEPVGVEAPAEPPTANAPGQLNLFPESEEGLASPYNPNLMAEQPPTEAANEAPATNTNPRQMELQLEQNPQTFYAGDQGVTNIHPDELQQYIQHLNNVNNPDAQMNLFPESQEGLATPYNPNRMAEEFLENASPQVQADRHQMDLQLEQNPPTYYGNEEGVTSLHPDLLEPFVNAAADRQTFEQVLGQLSEDGIKFKLPEDIDAAYDKYLDMVRDSESGGMFDRNTIADRFATSVKQEMIDRQLAANPVLQRMSTRIEGQQAKVAALKQRPTALRPGQLDREQATLQTMQDRYNTAEANIQKTLYGKYNMPGPYAKDGVVYMNSGLPLPEWMTKGLSNLLNRLHGVVFKWLNNKIRGPGNINGLKDIVHAGLKKTIENQVAKHYETQVNGNATAVIKKGPLSASEALKDFIPLDDKPLPEIKQMAMDAPDAKLWKATELTAQGGQVLSILTRNPIVKYTFDAFNRGEKSSATMIKQLLTDPHTGLKPLVQALNPRERGEIHALMDMHEGIKEFTPQELRQRGFNEKQIKYYQRFREVMDTVFNHVNESRAQLGMPPIERRIGYMAGRFMGDFRQLVYKKGTDEVVGFLGHNNRWALKAIQQTFERNNPGEYDFGPIKLQKSSGGNDMQRFQGYMEAMNFLAKANPDVSKIVDAYQNYLNQDANRVLGMYKHTMAKRGEPLLDKNGQPVLDANGKPRYKNSAPLFGAEGKKAWMSVERNAAEGMKSQLQYIENMVKWSNQQRSAETAKQLLSDPEIVQSKPRAFEIANNYMKHALGQGIGPLGKATNALMDAVAESTGIGPSYFRRANAWQKTKLLQLFLGYFRIPHSVINLSQFAQSNPGVMALLKSRGLDANLLDMSEANYNGLNTAAKYAMSKVGAPVKLTAFEKAAADYAENNDVFSVNLGTHLRNINQSKFSTTMQHMTELNITAPEAAIRSSSFFMYAHLLKDAGLSTKDALGAADNITRYAMVDYRPLERPQIYSKIGVFGDIASTLTRFKMNQLSQYLIARREAWETGHLMPLATLMATSIAFSGLTGLIGYNYANEAYKLITTHIFGKPDSLDGLILRHFGDFANFGVFSMLGINLTGSFSNADIIPDNVFGTLFPTGDTLALMAQSAAQAVYYHDKEHLEKAAYNFAPTSLKGIMENQLFTDQQGNFMNPNTQQLQTRRSSQDQLLRDFAFRPLNESKESRQVAATRDINEGYQGIRDRLFEKMQSYLIDNQPLPPELVDQWRAAQGTPQKLQAEIMKFKMGRVRTALQRAQGIPQGSNLGAAYRYLNTQSNTPNSQ